MRYLFDRSEAIELECDAVIRRHPSLSDGAEVIRARAGETVPPLAPGHYLISETTAPETDLQTPGPPRPLRKPGHFPRSKAIRPGQGTLPGTNIDRE